MKDQIEILESSAEDSYFGRVRPNGLFECTCGTLFDPSKEGGPASVNPYSLPVCEKCFGVGSF